MPEIHADVSLIIVNWNSSRYLRQCLSSMREQTVRPRHIIVVDNGSRGTSLSDIKKEYSDIDMDIEWIRLKENIGFAAANNLGARRAVGSHWLALLNPDAFPEPDWLANLLQAAEKHPQYSFFGCRMMSATHPDRLDGTGDIYHTSGLVWRHRHGCVSGEADLTYREIFSPCAAAALYRRDAFFEAGGFDDHYFCYSEDVDIGFRLRLLGYQCLYVPDAVVHHIGSATAGRHSDFSVYHGHRNLVWTFFKNMPFSLFLIYLPQHILLNIFSLIWFALQGQTSVILKAKSDAIKGIPLVWRKRKIIQTNRRVVPSALRK